MGVFLIVLIVFLHVPALTVFSAGIFYPANQNQMENIKGITLNTTKDAAMFQSLIDQIKDKLPPDSKALRWAKAHAKELQRQVMAKNIAERIPDKVFSKEFSYVFNRITPIKPSRTRVQIGNATFFQDDICWVRLDVVAYMIHVGTASSGIVGINFNTRNEAEEAYRKWAVDQD